MWERQIAALHGAILIPHCGGWRIPECVQEIHLHLCHMGGIGTLRERSHAFDFQHSHGRNGRFPDKGKVQMRLQRCILILLADFQLW